MKILDAINHGISILLSLLVIAGLFALWVHYIVQNINKYNKAIQERKPPKLSRGEIISQGIIYFLLTLVAIGLFWGLPFLVEKLSFGTTLETLIKEGAGWLFWIIQWVEVGLLAFVVFFILAQKYGEKRWIVSLVMHWLVLFSGWLFHHWIGVFLISLPLLVSYYGLLYHLSDVLLPASYPAEDGQTPEEQKQTKKEKEKRFIILAAFTWGLQFPILVVGKHAWKPPEVRIPGDFTWDYPVPGLVYTNSHQIAAITAGPEFRRVDGPGVVFTKKLERPFQVVDLRLQLRTNKIEVVSKDGISFTAIVFAAFRIDNEEWDANTYEKLRLLNPVLRGADRLDYTRGSFPFSRARIRATLGITSSQAADPKSVIPWDQWALKVIENEARKIIATKKLDELWLPGADKRFSGALETIANETKQNSAPILRARGILLYAARIVNFSFPAKDGKISPISEQQIASWKSAWEQKRAGILASAAAEAEEMQQEARVYAHKVLLEAIADGLEKTKEIHPHLPRYVIASRFLSALQDFIQVTSVDAQNAEIKKKISEMQTYLRDWQNTFFPGNEEKK